MSLSEIALTSRPLLPGQWVGGVMGTSVGGLKRPKRNKKGNTTVKPSESESQAPIAMSRVDSEPRKVWIPGTSHDGNAMSESTSVWMTVNGT